MSKFINIDFLGHACVVVEVVDFRIIFDPHLFSSYRSALFGYYPQRSLDIDKVVQNTNAIVISHSHRDHFDPVSIAHFPTSTPVICPNDRRIIFCLQELGFVDVILVSEWAQINLSRDVRVLVTPSEYLVPEYGFLVQYGEINVWNLVDCHVNDAWLETVNMYLSPKRMNCVLIPTQPLIEGNSTSDLPPFVTSKRAIEASRIIEVINPEIAIPFADGHNCLGPISWLNHHWMPFSQSRKFKSLSDASNTTKILELNTGDRLKLSATGDSYTELSKYVKDIDNRNRGEFEPSRVLPMLRAFDTCEESEFFEVCSSIFSNDNLESTLPRIRSISDKGPTSAKYKFVFLDEHGRPRHEVLLRFDAVGGLLRKQDFEEWKKGELTCIEAAMPIDLFVHVVRSEFEFSALLIGGFIRECVVFGEFHLPRIISMADVLDIKGEFFVSGIFLFNQILLAHGDKSVCEIISQLSGKMIAKLPDRPVPEPVLVEDYPTSNFGDHVKIVVEEILEGEELQDLWSSYRRNGAFAGRILIFGHEICDPRVRLFFQERFCGVEKVFLFANYGVSQSLFGGGNSASRELGWAQLEFLDEFHDRIQHFCLGLAEGLKLGDWRMLDLFPILWCRDKLSFLQPEINCFFQKYAENGWWRGYPSPSKSGERGEIVCTMEDSTFRGIKNPVNEDSRAWMFSNHFVARAPDCCDMGGAIDKFVEGEFRMTWLSPQNEWSALGIDAHTDLDLVKNSIVMKLIRSSIS